MRFNDQRGPNGGLAVAKLMDIKPDIALADEIRGIATKVDGAKYIEKVVVRNMGPNLYVDLHLERG